MDVADECAAVGVPRITGIAIDPDNPNFNIPQSNEGNDNLAMQALADLRMPIDAFFEAVQINTDNQILRRNRLNLLSSIRGLCLDVADLTRIDG